MRGDRHLTFVAAAATLLAAAPMSAIFDRWTWLVQCAVAVALISGAAVLARRFRISLWGQGLAMAAGLLFALTWLFPAGKGLLALLPTPATLGHFAELLTASAGEMRSYGVPVPDTDPLLFVTVLGIGVVAIVVDLCAVGIRRPALAGLPMLAIYSVPVAVYPGSVPPAPFIIGAAGFLWLLVADNIERVRQFGRRFTGDGRSVDVWEPSPLAAAGRRLALLGVVLAVLVPLGVPGMTSGPLNQLSGNGGNGSGRGGTGGRPGQINLFAALSGQLNQSEVHDLVKVTTDDPEPFYLRFGVADQLRLDGFAIGRPSGPPVNRVLSDPRDRNWPAGVTQRQFHATVEVTDDFNMPLLPVYTEPVNLRDVGSGWRYDGARQIVFADRSRSKGKKYSFDYVRSTYSRAALEAARSLPERDPLRQFTVVPEPIPQVNALVAKLTDGQRTDYDRVRAIYDYFSRENGFSYSLRTEGGTRGSDIVNFLDTKVGFCQQYAAAMAWLVRAAGIPARVAFGFSNGDNRHGKTYTLTNLNLHAWTEVYFTGIGWVPFDATPAASVPGSTRSAWAPDTDAPDPVTPSAVPTPGAAGQNNAGTEPGRRTQHNVDEGSEGVAGPSQQAPPSWPWWALVGVVLVLGLLALPATRRAVLRRRRYRRPVAARAAVVDAGGVPGEAVIELDRSTVDRADAHAAWDELIDTLVDYRLRVDLTRSPRTLTEQLIGQGLAGTAAADAARLLGRAEERARYARDPLSGQPLAEALGRVRTELRAGADRRTRLAAAVLPPSVLLSWRARVVDTATRLISWGGRWRDALVRWSPRRLLVGRVSR